MQRAILIKPYAQFPEKRVYTHTYASTYNRLLFHLIRLDGHSLQKLFPRKKERKKETRRDYCRYFPPRGNHRAGKGLTRRTHRQPEVRRGGGRGGGGVLRARYLRGGALINYSQFCVRFTRIISTANNYFNALILRRMQFVRRYEFGLKLARILRGNLRKSVYAAHAYICVCIYVCVCI